MKTVGIIQSNYLPWRGYFNFIQDVDTFIFLDDAQYTRRDWRNRNRIKTKDGAAWVTVPVRDEFGKTRICDAEVMYDSDWVGQQLGAIRSAYSRAPYFDCYFSQLCEFLSIEWSSISSLNQALCKWLSKELGVDTELRCATEFGCSGVKSEKLLSLVEAVGGDRYLAGPAARDYLDVELFESRSVEVYWKEYDYPEYKQLWGAFRGDVSVLDLLFNHGDSAKEFLYSWTANKPT